MIWRQTDLAAARDHALAVAVAALRLGGLNRLGNSGDLATVPRPIQGGTGGLEARRAALGRVERILGLAPAPDRTRPRSHPAPAGPSPRTSP